MCWWCIVQMLQVLPAHVHIHSDEVSVLTGLALTSRHLLPQPSRTGQADQPDLSAKSAYISETSMPPKRNEKAVAATERKEAAKARPLPCSSSSSSSSSSTILHYRRMPQMLAS